MPLPFVLNNPLRDFYGQGAGPTIQAPSSDYPIPDQFVGIELEFEGVTMRDPPPIGWDAHEDGSLRNGIELVTSSPVVGQTLTDRINSVAEWIDQRRSRIVPTFRTSTHIHLNYSSTVPYQSLENLPDTVCGVHQTLLLYYALEPLFYAVAGNDREFTGFCYSYQTNQRELVDFLCSSRANIGGIGRYYGLNFVSLSNHGTLEFRHMPLLLDTASLTRWIRTLMRLKSLAYRVGVTSALRNADAAYLVDEAALRAAAEEVFQEYPDVLPQLNTSEQIRRVRRLLSMVTAIAGQEEAPEQEQPSVSVSWATAGEYQETGVSLDESTATPEIRADFVQEVMNTSPFTPSRTLDEYLRVAQAIRVPPTPRPAPRPTIDPALQRVGSRPSTPRRRSSSI